MNTEKKRNDKMWRTFFFSLCARQSQTQNMFEFKQKWNKNNGTKYEIRAIFFSGQIMKKTAAKLCELLLSIIYNVNINDKKKREMNCFFFYI